MDLATQTSHLYVDGVDELVEAFNIDGTFDWTVADWELGALVSSAWYLDGAISEMYLDTTTYTNFSAGSNRLLFADADGVAVDLGQTCEIPSGSQPILCMFKQDNVGGNSGYGGDFSLVGSPTLVGGPFPANPIIGAVGGGSVGGRGRGRMK